MKRFIATAAAFCLILSLSACGTEKKEYTSFAMGSVITASVFGDDAEKTDEVWDSVCTDVKNADDAISTTTQSSDIARINTGGSAKVSEYTVEFLEKAVLLCNTLDRKLDITLGAVTSLWGFTDGTPKVPDENELKSALATADVGEIYIDEDNLSVSVADGQKLDLGALGKGEACDIMKDAFIKNGLSACVSFGGNVLVTGKNPNNRKGIWKIGVRDPLGSETDVFASLSLDSSNGAVCVSTSGSYEKKFEENGKTYHHIIDPSTGYPVGNGLIAVSVVCASGLNADALSTACFVNGLNDTSLLWLKSFSAEAVFVFEDGSVYKTDGLSQNFTIINTDTYREVTYEQASK